MSYSHHMTKRGQHSSALWSTATVAPDHSRWDDSRKNENGNSNGGRHENNWLVAMEGVSIVQPHPSRVLPNNSDSTRSAANSRRSLREFFYPHVILPVLQPPQPEHQERMVFEQQEEVMVVAEEEQANSVHTVNLMEGSAPDSLSTMSQSNHHHVNLQAIRSGRSGSSSPSRTRRYYHHDQLIVGGYDSQ